MSIEDQLSASQYLARLSKLSELEPSELSSAKPAELSSALSKICHDLKSYIFEDLEHAESILLQAKSDFNYLWAIAELSSSLTQPQLGRWQTQFAEVTISFALKLAWLKIAPKHKAITQSVVDANGEVAGLFIFGMGKLGGHDLNFSSDVDLIAYFDPQVIPVPEVLGKSYVCHQVLQSLSKILSQAGASNFIWRVDWMLRPNASATTLAMSVNAAEDYYFYRASPWHRLALMKARVVAGDIDLGKQFLKVLTPFIWRQNLDYRALDELAEIKQRINLEHPSLRAQRQWAEPISNDIAGYNVKLGSGGIREIEFIANALQLLWGGRHYSLRTPNTLDAIDALFDLGKLTKEVATTLGNAYQYQRRLENAIQMLGNQQTHLIPKSADNQRRLLVLLGLDEWSALVEELNLFRAFVHQYFEQLFEEQTTAQGEAVVWPDGLSEQADDIVDAWEGGFINYGVSNQVRHRLRPLTRGIASYLADHQGDASNTVIRLHDFFRVLPGGEQYFRLLAESPALLASIVPPLLHSPAMTLLLKQSPHIIDCYVHQQWRYPQPFDSSFVIQADDYGERLERMRRFVNEHLYQLYLSFMEGALSVELFQKALTELAEHSLELALIVVANKMELESVPITVIGMGKVALGKMSPLSDLDLIFVFDQTDTSLDLASRFVSRLQTAISTPMREGILYELDTRLRPSGRSGAPTVSIESFANHHLTRAHTWEHIALVPSRIVAGNRAPEARLNAIKEQLISQPREELQLLNDAQKMWRRIALHRVKPIGLESMFSKLREGGLMQVEYLAACLILHAGHRLPITSVEFDHLLALVDDSQRLNEAIQFWRIQQLWERLLGKSERAVASLPADYLARMLQQLEVSSIEQLVAKKEMHSNYVQQRMAQFFASNCLNPEQLEDWLESKVNWL
ncbi:MAG: glutamate-ammonia-ligase adenylyltransferase [Arenicella sp.]|jgi:glutamate-ammonia-ligase adenylyltransferase